MQLVVDENIQVAVKYHLFLTVLQNFFLKLFHFYV